MKKTFLILLIALTALFLFQTGGSAEVVDFENDLVLSDDGYSPGEEIPADPLVVTWLDTADKTGKSKLSFMVTNNSDEELDFAVAVVAESPLGTADKSLGKKKLAPDGIADFSVDSSALPVLSDTVVSTLSVRLTRKVGSKDVSSRSEERFYKHDLTLEKLDVYTSEELDTVLDGAILDIQLSADQETMKKDVKKTIGYVSDNSGGYKSKSLADSNLATYDDSGNLIGVVTWIGTGKKDFGPIDADLIESIRNKEDGNE